MTVKAWIAGLLLLFLGVVLGGWAPRVELRAAKAEIAALKQTRPTPTNARLGQVQALLRIDEAEATGKRSRRASPAPTADETADDRPTEPAVPAAPAEPAAPMPSPPDAPSEAGRPATFQERLETASQVWRLRADLARQRLFDRVQPEPDQAASFDVLMEAMNLRLGAAIDDWAARIAEADEVSPAMGVRMMHDITGVLALTYDELDRTLPPAWQANDDGAFELVTFIDPEVATPLIEIEGALRASQPNRRRPFGPPTRP